MPEVKSKKMSVKTKVFPRVNVEKVSPEIDGGRFAIKRVLGEKVSVQASVFADGHDEIVVRLAYRPVNESDWQYTDMLPLGNDRWEGCFEVERMVDYVYTVEGCIDVFGTWQRDLKKKWEAGVNVNVDLLVGAELLERALERVAGDDADKIRSWAEQFRAEDAVSATVALASSEDLHRLMRDFLAWDTGCRYVKELPVTVDRKKALFSTWYEFFPRSWGPDGKHGTFRDCEGLLPEIARMGFDVVYFPPIHPVGETNRKGKNNSVICGTGDPGCPWAIGSKDGGHKSINAALGTMEDFKHFIEEAKRYGIEVALDIAYQCSPDHPYVKAHPEWFRWRPDGTIQFAENPPKKYEDVLPINFETADWRNLWNELKSIVQFWAEQGVRIFRVDNPHTKQFDFWDWMIADIRKDYPQAIFLAEAFTRPHVMYRLAKGGFTQSYTYFTWRNTKQEFIDYLTVLTQTEVVEYFRPNFWPNTPDILPVHLQSGGRPAFMMRLILAATLSSNYGMYGPVFELCVNEAIPQKEEYARSEKYELRSWSWDQEGHLKDVIARMNQIRRENPALQETRNIRFCETNNDSLLAYYKMSRDGQNIILVIVNLDPYHTQSGMVTVPLPAWNIEPARPYLAHDLLSNDRYIWQGESNYVELNPHVSPAHVIRVRPHLHREQDFDYFM